MLPLWIPSPEELRRLRERAGLSQRELARRAGVSQALIARLERGQVDVRLSTLQRILSALMEALGEKDRAEDYMTSPVITIRADEPVRRAVEVMYERGFSQIPVVNERGVVVGTLLESTLLKLLLSEGDSILDEPAHRVMDEPLPQVARSTPIYAVEVLLASYPAVLVVGPSGLEGIITKIDVLKRRSG